MKRHIWLAASCLAALSWAGIPLAADSSPGSQPAPARTVRERLLAAGPRQGDPPFRPAEAQGLRAPDAGRPPGFGERPGPFGAGLDAVLIRIPSAAGGEEGIAASLLIPAKPRFSEGAPVVIDVTGGVQAGGARGRPEYVGFGFVEIHFAFPGGGEGDQRSGGTYDFRGPNCIRALADVIRFATGRLADRKGRHLGELVPGMKVLTHNCGIVGSSHGGNACGLAMAMYGEEFPDLAWYASMESPYGEGAANVELGGHESGVNPAHDPQTGVLDLSRLAWSPDLSPGLFGKQMPVGTRELKGAFFFDLNGDGRFSPGADFPANCFVGDDGKGVKAWYSPRILAEAAKRKLIGDAPPRHIPSLEEAKEFWRYRDAAPSIPEAVRKCPRVAVIVYANQRDHVQAAPDHGHILEQIEGFRRAKARFVRLNPDRAYLEWVLAAGPGPRGAGPGGPGPGGIPAPAFPKARAGIPDNPAGQAYDRSNIAGALEPAVLPLGLCMQAAVCELADRVQAGNWDANLDAVLFPDAPAAPALGLPPRRAGFNAAAAPVEGGAPPLRRPPLGPAEAPDRPQRLAGENRPPRGEPEPSPVAPSSAPHPGAADRRGYITFVVNVHDWTRAGESADTVLRLVELFERHKVRGEFYLTAPAVEAYAQQRPEVIRRLRESEMTISYHFRPPHPAYGGFDRRLRGLDDQALAAALGDYETYRLDPGSGDLDRTRPGGYAYVAKTLGRKPVVVSALTRDPRVKTALLDIYRSLGAQMTMEYHESGTDLSEPYRWRQGLLIRPSDFSVTRWAAPGETQESFWWNRLDTPQADQFQPTSYLQRRLVEWKADRLPLITSLIHENDFTRRGSPGWAWFYYANPDSGPPLSPPFDLKVSDRTPLRTAAQQEAIWKAYDALVAYAAAHLQVVTSVDIVKLASQRR